MEKYAINTGYPSMTDTAFTKEGISVREGMTGNPNFEDLADKVTETVAALDAYIASIPPKNIRNQVNVAAKDELRMVANEKMMMLAHLVMAQSIYNKEAMESSGFTLRSTRTRRAVPPVPENVKPFITNDPQTMLVSCDPNKLADIYEVKISEDNENWNFGNNGISSKVMVSNVPTGVLLYVKMRLKNSAGEGAWSNPVQARLPLPSEPLLKRVDL